MGKFIAGIIVGIVGVLAGTYIYIHYGFLDLRADKPAGAIERIYMSGAMDRYSARYAPRSKNPVSPTDEDLIEGIRLYKANCGVCHGGPDLPISEVGRGLLPRAPQFLRNSPPDMPEHENFWIIKHGIARTGMPAWGNLLSDLEIWKLTTFLSKMEDLPKLSPAVQQAWASGEQRELGGQQKKTKSPAVAMPEPPQHGHDHHHHED